MALWKKIPPIKKDILIQTEAAHRKPNKEDKKSDSSLHIIDETNSDGVLKAAREISHVSVKESPFE